MNTLSVNVRKGMMTKNDLCRIEHIQSVTYQILSLQYYFHYNAVSGIFHRREQ